MQAKPSCCAVAPNEPDDLRNQRVVLTHVLALHPAHLRVAEIVCDITAGSEEFAEGDGLERAIRDLTGAGLLCCPGGVVMPTRAALHVDRLGVL
jgi:hypothetical protein